VRGIGNRTNIFSEPALFSTSGTTAKGREESQVRVRRRSLFFGGGPRLQRMAHVPEILLKTKTKFKGEKNGRPHQDTPDQHSEEQQQLAGERHLRKKEKKISRKKKKSRAQRIAIKTFLAKSRIEKRIFQRLEKIREAGGKINMGDKKEKVAALVKGFFFANFFPGKKTV